MKALNRRHLRTIRKNLSFYISAVLITMFAIFIFMSILATKEGLQDYVDTMAEEHSVEDAQFILAEELTDEEIEELEDTYHLTLEQMRYINSKEEDYTLRVFAATEKINTYEVYEGGDITSNDEILLSKGFAAEHGIEIGDAFALQEREYTVSGYFIRPDYINMLETENGSYRDNEAFGIALVSEDEFESEELGVIKFYYSVIYGEDNDLEFRQALNDDYTLMKYTSAAINGRIQNIYDSTETYAIMAYFVFILMVVLTTLLISLILSRKLEAEQKQIGTLKASGFRNGEIMRHYLVMPLVGGLLGSLAGIGLSAAMLQMICENYAADYEPVPITYHLPPIGVALSIVLPALMYVAFSALSMRKILKKNVVSMLNAAEETKKAKKGILANNRSMKFGRKFIIRNILGNKGRTVVVLFGLLVGCYVMVLGCVATDSCQNFIDTRIDSIGSYEYQYSLNTYMTEEREDATCAVSALFEPDGLVTSFTMLGLDDSSLLELKNQDGNEVLIDEDTEDWYISTMASMAYGVGEGDKLVFYSLTTMEEYSVTIDGVIDNDAQEMVYSSQNNVCQLLDIDSGSYNLIFSTQEQDIDEALILTSTTKTSLKNQIKAVINDMAAMISMITYIGVILCVISVYLTVDMLISENRMNAVMLRVLGFRKREVNHLIIDSYHVLVPVAIVAGIILGVLSGQMLFLNMIDTYGCYIHSIIAVPSVVFCAALTVLSYIVSLALLKRKLNRVNLVESLKAEEE